MKRVLFVLGQLSDQDIEWMIDNGTKQSIQQGNYLVQQGNRLDHIYLILSGHFRIYDQAKSDVSISTISSGEIIGEMSFLDDHPPTVSVVALENSSVHAIPLDQMQQYMADNRDFAARFYYSIALFLSDRLRKTTSRLGYGEVDEDTDELNFQVLEQVGQAGSRFKRMLNKFAER